MDPNEKMNNNLETLHAYLKIVDQHNIKLPKKTEKQLDELINKTKDEVAEVEVEASAAAVATPNIINMGANLIGIILRGVVTDIGDDLREFLTTQAGQLAEQIKAIIDDLLNPSNNGEDVVVDSDDGGSSGGSGSDSGDGGSSGGSGSDSGGGGSSGGSDKPDDDDDFPDGDSDTIVKKGTVILFEDMRAIEESYWQKLRQRYTILDRRIKDEKVLPPSLADELSKLKTLFIHYEHSLKPYLPRAGDVHNEDFIQDLLFKRLMEQWKLDNGKAFKHQAGLFPSQFGDQPKDLNKNEKAVAAVYGIMLRDGMRKPTNNRRFHKALSLARAEFNAHRHLYMAVFDELRDESIAKYKVIPYKVPKTGVIGGLLTNMNNTWVNDAVADQLNKRKHVERIYTERWAAIVQSLIKDGITAGHPYLKARIESAIEVLDGAFADAPPSSIQIELPDLEAQVDVEIIAENLHAMQGIYFAGMLEELRLFQVRDKLIELFQLGMLPVVRGHAGDLLYQQMRRSVTRMSEYERRNLYARTLGSTGGGEMQNIPNRDFQTLWLRFVSAVSSYARQLTVDSLLRANYPARVHQEQVRKAGRDLSANLSLYGYGMAYFAATELQTEINEIIEVLSDPEIMGAYGARDMWGVVDQIAVLELGGARDSVRYRTMASSGAIIIRWLANHAEQLSSVGSGDILDSSEIARPNIRSQGTKVTQTPFDSDLVNACERWLAVTGTPEAQVEEYAQPIESPTMTSRPIQVPSIARDMLDSVGIPLGQQFGANRNGYRKDNNSRY